MLLHLSIQNFTTVDQLELEFNGGLTVITGETGAGKSIVLDAIGLSIGDRVQADCLRDNSKNASITATFALDHDDPRTPEIITWLSERDLHSDDSGDELMLRRVITPQGRTRAYINNMPVAVSDVKALGEQLVDLHNQHEHQSLLHTQTHQRLLDEYGEHAALLAKTLLHANAWHTLQARIALLEKNQDELQAQQQLLSYQVAELDKLAPAEDEVDNLRETQQRLSNAETLSQSNATVAKLCDGDDENTLSQLISQAVQHLKQHQAVTSAFDNTISLLEDAKIQIAEASDELRHLDDQFQIDPERLRDTESRLDNYYQLARKHRTEAENLHELHADLAEQLAALSGDGQDVEQLREQLAQYAADYEKAANKLSKQRQKTADKLAGAINQQLEALAMGHCEIGFALHPRGDQASPTTPHPQGQETIELLIRTIPGKPMQALKKIASGGELSRISLAIQVVVATTSRIPTLIFDEVDVGISGGVAEMVGDLLRQLGNSGQVMCITHLPQVAAKGHQHLLARKTIDKQHASTELAQLDSQQREEEIARLLGGVKVTQRTRDHAAEMLATS